MCLYVMMTVECNNVSAIVCLYVTITVEWMTARHTEGPPTVFGCALNYITMRLLGVTAQDKDLLSARNMLRNLGNYYLLIVVSFTAG